MTDPLAFLTAALDAADLAARKAAALCGCHPPAPSWSFRDGDEPTDGRILVVDDPHPDVKRKIGRRWNGSYEDMFMAEHIARHDPAATLRRIAAERKILAEIARGVEYEAEGLADTIISNLAEGWGWSEEEQR